MNFLRFTKVTKTALQKRNVHVHNVSTTAEAIHAWKKSNVEAISLLVLCFGIVPLWLKYNSGDENAKKLILYDQDHLPTHLRKRAKPFAWSCYNCALLDGPCQRECKAEEATKKALYEKYLAKKNHSEATKL